MYRQTNHRSPAHRKADRRCRLFYMKRLLIIIFLLNSCSQPDPVILTDKVDPDIVLINIEEGDRSFIGNLLLTIDSCKPKLIGIDAWFVLEKDNYQDSILITALKKIDNDILAYKLDSSGEIIKSHKKFREQVNDEGLAIYENNGDVSSNMIPITTIDNKEHELFALKIIKKWKPDFNYHYKLDQTIPIHFIRSLEQFVHFNGSDLKTHLNYKDLHDKIVLLGYLGPSNEDKHFTPIRRAIKFNKKEPDTYGLVIIANEIRTLLKNNN